MYPVTREPLIIFSQRWRRSFKANAPANVANFGEKKFNKKCMDLPGPLRLLLYFFSTTVNSDCSARTAHFSHCTNSHRPARGGGHRRRCERSSGGSIVVSQTG